MPTKRKARLEKTRSLYESVARVEDTYQAIAGKDIAGKDIAGNSAAGGFLHYSQEVKEMVDGMVVLYPPTEGNRKNSGHSVGAYR